MSERTLNWGPDETDARYQSGEDDGNFVVARDTDGNQILLQYNDVTDTWEHIGDVDIDGDLSVNAIDSTAVSTGGAVIGENAGHSGVAPERPLISNEHKSVSVPGDYDTIQAALADCPVVLRHNYRINVDPEGYTEQEDVIVPQVLMGDIGDYKGEGTSTTATLRIHSSDAPNHYDINSIITTGGYGTDGISFAHVTIKGKTGWFDSREQSIATLGHGSVRFYDLRFDPDEQIDIALETKTSDVKIQGDVCDFGEGMYQDAIHLKDHSTVYITEGIAEGEVEVICDGGHTATLSFPHGIGSLTATDRLVTGNRGPGIFIEGTNYGPTSIPTLTMSDDMVINDYFISLDGYEIIEEDGGTVTHTGHRAGPHFEASGAGSRVGVEFRRRLGGTTRTNNTDAERILKVITRLDPVDGGIYRIGTGTVFSDHTYMAFHLEHGVLEGHVHDGNSLETVTLDSSYDNPLASLMIHWNPLNKKTDFWVSDNLEGSIQGHGPDGSAFEWNRVLQADAQHNDGVDANMYLSNWKFHHEAEWNFDW